MISLHSTGSPAQTSDAYTLLALIADPARAKAHLDAMVAEKQAHLDAAESARKATAEAKELHDKAIAKLAEAKRVADDFTRDHAARTKSLDDRHVVLVVKDSRLTAYEAQVAARENALGEPLLAREKAVEAKEAALNKREDDLHDLAANLAKAKEELDVRAKKISEALK